MNGGPKDNENPVVLNVSKRTSRRREDFVGWDDVQQLLAASASPREDNDLSDYISSKTKPTISPEPHDYFVMQALQDVASATNGEGVALLERVLHVSLRPPATTTTTTTISPPPVFITPPKKDAMDIDKETTPKPSDDNKQLRDDVTVDEIFDIIKNIQDPEHPLTLEQLGVVSREQITLVLPKDDDVPYPSVHVRFTPTVPHCSMATMIGLFIRVKLLRSLPPHFKLQVTIEPGTHQSEHSVNRQVNDKERVCAALENPHLLKIANRCIINGMTGNMS